jgi:hypothetical protein
MTNFFLVTLIVTNWVDLPGYDFKRESGTNYVRKRQVIETNTYAFEVMLCTNKTLLKSMDSGTNGPILWKLQTPPLTPLPTLIRSKE